MRTAIGAGLALGMTLGLAWTVPPVGVTPAWAAGWRTYVNDRFGTTASVPADWAMQPAPDNDDGRVFVSPDGQARVTVSGSFEPESPAAGLRLRTQAGEGETITYRHVGRAAVTVSGTRGAAIVYRASVLGCRGRVWNDIEISYPAARKAEFDDLVAHMAVSLQAGRGIETGRCR